MKYRLLVNRVITCNLIVCLAALSNVWVRNGGTKLDFIDRMLTVITAFVGVISLCNLNELWNMRNKVQD